MELQDATCLCIQIEILIIHEYDALESEDKRWPKTSRQHWVMAVGIVICSKHQAHPYYSCKSCLPSHPTVSNVMKSCTATTLDIRSECQKFQRAFKARHRLR